MIYTFQIYAENLREVVNSLRILIIPKILTALLIILVSYMVGEQHLHLLGALTVLIGIDLITGVYAAYYNNSEITSRKMIKTAIKWTLYMLMVSASYLTEQIVPSYLFLVEVCLAFLALTELVSILENIGKTGTAVPLRLLNKLNELKEKQ